MGYPGGGGGVGWCMTGCAGGAQDKISINRILLRFRPIAPKPVTGEADCSKTFKVSKGKTKRKYVRVNKSRGNRKKVNLIGSENGRNGEKKMVTLQLLPEKDNGVKSSETITDMAVRPSVRVESVTDRWRNEEVGLGSTDKERKKNLEEDTCPGFISDGLNRVIWVNEAYKGMIKEWKVMRVVMKEKLVYEYGAFTSQVKVEYGYGKMMVPCDGWRMDNGGFAWRLDVKAALSLGH